MEPSNNISNSNIYFRGNNNGIPTERNQPTQVRIPKPLIAIKPSEAKRTMSQAFDDTNSALKKFKTAYSAFTIFNAEARNSAPATPAPIAPQAMPPSPLAPEPTTTTATTTPSSQRTFVNTTTGEMRERLDLERQNAQAHEDLHKMAGRLTTTTTAPNQWAYTRQPIVGCNKFPNMVKNTSPLEPCDSDDPVDNKELMRRYQFEFNIKGV